MLQPAQIDCLAIYVRNLRYSKVVKHHTVTPQFVSLTSVNGMLFVEENALYLIFKRGNNQLLVKNMLVLFLIARNKVRITSHLYIEIPDQVFSVV